MTIKTHLANKENMIRAHENEIKLLQQKLKEEELKN